MTNWKEQGNPFLGFTEELTYEWMRNGFDRKQVKEWLDIGMKVEDAGFCAWLRDEVKVDALEILNNMNTENGYQEEDLREQYEEYLVNNRLSEDVIEKLKNFQDNFKNWTSGNPEIDEFIQKQQLSGSDLKWIPYEQFTNISDKPIGEGGFGKVYKAEWVAGDWSIEQHEKSAWGNWVALKSLNNSQNIVTDFLQEITNHRLIRDSRCIVKCYGISQDPKKNYVMVSDYMDEGNLRKYFNDNWLSFEDRIYKLQTIASGLCSIHEQGLVHKDFHAGNILNGRGRSYVSDLGLCRPANSEKEDGKIHGVMPFLAPEVLWGEPYTPASDIYSFGVVVYEVISNCPPYYELAHDKLLSYFICKGLRPKFNAGLPQLFKDLIDRCWDANPEKRPTASELSEILQNWFHDIGNENTEFDRQYNEVKKSNKKLSVPTKNKTPLKTHPQSFYTSRLLDTKSLPKPQNSKEINDLFYTVSDYYSKGKLSDDDYKWLIKFFEAQEELINLGTQDNPKPKPSEISKVKHRLRMFEGNLRSKLKIEKEQLDEILNKSKKLVEKQLIKQWQSLNFTVKQQQEWISANSFSQQENQVIQEPEYYAWLRDIKQITPNQLINYSQEQKQELIIEYQKQFQTNIEVLPKQN